LCTRWRVDPRFVGPSYVLGDLATHPLFLVETMAPQLLLHRLGVEAMSKLHIDDTDVAQQSVGDHLPGLDFSSEEADDLVALSQRQHKIIGVTYGYAGHQLILTCSPASSAARQMA
jgi:hypothetical protein